MDAPCGPDGLRPIHIAAREGHIQSLRYLSVAGACLQKCDVNGFSALHHGAIGGQVRAVRWLLRHGAKISLDKRGRSPIQVATDHDHMEVSTTHTFTYIPICLCCVEGLFYDSSAWNRTLIMTVTYVTRCS